MTKAEKIEKAKAASAAKAKDTMKKLVAMFEAGDVGEKIARSIIARQAGDNRPSDKWSALNRLIMLLSDTEDARSFKAWEKVGRYPVKGSKAFAIWAPVIKKITERDEITGEETSRTICIGFRPHAVFRIEDTDGEPVPSYTYEPAELPPLYEVAEKFGAVRYLPMDNGNAWGSTNIYNGEIKLYTEEVGTFFHELTHLVHGAIVKEETGGTLIGGQHTDQETIAEFTAAALCELYGFEGRKADAWDYIKHYNNEDPEKALKEIGRHLATVEKIIDRIFETKAEIEATA